MMHHPVVILTRVSTVLTWRVVSWCIQFLHSLHSDPCRCAHRKRASKTRTFALSSEGQPRHRNPCCFRAGSTPGPFLWRAMFHMFHQESGWLMLVENQAPDQENNKLLLTTGFNHLGDVEKWTVEARSNHEPEETTSPMESFQPANTSPSPWVVKVGIPRNLWFPTSPNWATAQKQHVLWHPHSYFKLLIHP